ncbi:MAG: DinB family protein [Planctomycetota bacterium]
MSTTATTTIESIVPAARLMQGYAKMLVDDIPADRFHEMPHPTMNHPAFCLGHLAIYPNRVLEMIGKPELVDDKDGFDELFAAGVECAPNTGQYPDKDTVVDFFMDRHEVLINALSDLDESVFQQENPREGRFREMCPTVGAAINFLLTAHVGTHLGQISAWRRAVGMPSAM